GQPALLGPGSAFGLFQRGPAYYYFLLSGLTAAGGDPIGAALAIVVLDTATIVLIFFAARSVSGLAGGLAAAALYATAGATVSLARAFSNPSVLPFLSLLLFISALRLVRGDPRFLVVVFGAGA